MMGKNNSTRISIKKWGNGQGILLPKSILNMLSLSTNDELSLEIIDGKIILSPIRYRYLSLAERFANFNEISKQEEYWTDTPIGKEQI